VKTAVVGGGLLGLTLAHRLSALGHSVELVEAAPELGGLAAPQQFGPFVWDRFYHCILPHDGQLIGLLKEVGLGDELRWTRTGTGYCAGGRFYSMSGNADYIRFPLLSVVDKARLAATVLHATHTAKPYDLYRLSAQDWLTRWCGRRGYETFWQPLLKAKFGPYFDRVAAVFIWATLTRLQGARDKGSREQLGYVRGGYARILGTLREKLEGKGVTIRTGSPVKGIELSDHTQPNGRARVTWGGSAAGTTEVDQVFFTAPTGLAAKVVGESLKPVVNEALRRYPTSGAYLGVACMTLVLKRPLTPYYVLNIADPNVELTGIIEMTNLVDRAAETKGLSLVYLPRYMDSTDPAFDSSDQALIDSLLDRGVRRLYPDLADSDIVDRQVHRARLVQPLPLVRQGKVVPAGIPALTRPFTLLNTSMLDCATLNNNEVVGLVDRFLLSRKSELGSRA
jgi:protoporphyrinogen oxidase